MISKEMIFQQLRALGCPQDSAVIVHTSLRAVGAVEGSGEGLLDALIEYITADGGLLCIPTHTWSNFGRADCPFVLDMQSDKTCIGILPQLAAAHPAGERSENPTHSMVVFGADAKAFIQREKMIKTPLSPEGCYAGILERKGFILLLGVGQDKNTFLHAVEEMLIGNRRLTDRAYPMKIRRKDGSVEIREMRAFSEDEIGDVSERFPKFEPAFRAFGAVRYGKLGAAQAQLCDAAGMLAAMKRIYQRAQGKELLADQAPLDPALYE